MDLNLSIKNSHLTTMRMYAKRLERLEIFMLRDLLFLFPHRYDDLSLTSSIALAQNGETVTIRGVVIEAKTQYTRRGFNIQNVVIKDETGQINCVWFNQPFILNTLHVADTVSVSGRVEMKGANKNIMVKSYEVLYSENTKMRHTGILVPIYPETRGVSSKWIRNRIAELLEQVVFDEYLPQELITSHKLLELSDAIAKIHFPKSIEDSLNARRRLSFDELFLIQLSAVIKREEWKQKVKSKPFKIKAFTSEIQKLIDSLPFTLTNAQIKAFKSISKDLTSNTPMNRMLEGDVGSGKTVVAAVAIYSAFLNSYQSVLMAPTEILANQHFDTISRILTPFGVKVGLITGSYKKEKEKQHDVLIGTHALIHKTVTFDTLNLVIIDEQQRFGVRQRSVLRDKGVSPHFLTMTATPIPRTVFLAMYGDLDISYLDEMPKGRTKIKTWLVPASKRAASYEWLKQQVNKVSKGRSGQVFIICPFIEESESATTVKAALKEFALLKDEVFKEYSVGLLHGKMKSTEKKKVLDDFHKGKIDILVATPVVEVGIDIPNATVMVIEAAERFGLSQLHQLRGRVGRSKRESFCLLFTESDNPTTVKRLKSLERVQNGATLAEIDLKLRGPGDMYGTAQHGIPRLKIASFSDRALLEATRNEAHAYFPKLQDYPSLKQQVKSTIIQEVSPD